MAGLVTVAVLLYAFYPRIGAWAIRKKVISKLEKRLDRDVKVRSIEVTRGGKAILKGVTIRGPRDGEEPLIRIARVVITYDFWASVRGKIIVDKVSVKGLHAAILRHDKDNDNYSDILRRFTGRGDKRKRSGFGRGLRPKVLTLSGGSFTFRDAVAGVRLGGDKLSGVAKPGGIVRANISDVRGSNSLGQTGGVDKVVVTADLKDVVGSAQVELAGGQVKLWRGMSLSGIAGTVAKGRSPGRLLVDLAGGYGGARGQLWDAKGWIEPRTRTSSLSLRADRFTFDRIASVVRKTPVVVDYKDTSVDVAMKIDVSAKGVSFSGDMSLYKLNIFHRKLADDTLRNLEVAGKIRGGFDRAARTLRVDSADLSSHGVDFSVSGALHLPGGVDPKTGAVRGRKRVSGLLVVPPVPCQTVLDAFPTQLMPHLQGFKLGGTFKTRLEVDVDRANLKDTTLEGSIGILRCRALKAPKAMSAKRLKKEFTHYAEVQNKRWIPLVLGDQNPEFIPLWDVSPYLIKAFLTTEDGRFYRHKGFIIHEFRSALIRNLEAGYFKFGASSISMQVVKNVLLYRGKTLSRKLQELFLTWYIETKLSKDRIMEIYVNAIEFGPGVYGIGKAAQYYFDKHPRDLTPVEAAFFSTILPSPKKRHRQFCRNKPSKWTLRYLQTILRIMKKRKHITEDEYDLAKETPLKFNRDEDEISPRECTKLARKAMKQSKAKHPVFAP